MYFILYTERILSKLLTTACFSNLKYELNLLLLGSILEKG
jgi:hypothetical protein